MLIINKQMLFLPLYGIDSYCSITQLLNHHFLDSLLLRAGYLKSCGYSLASLLSSAAAGLSDEGGGGSRLLSVRAAGLSVGCPLKEAL